MSHIGGYFSFEQDSRTNAIPWMDSAISVQSGRMALLYELQHRNIETIWLPYFYCDTVPSLLQNCGYDIKFYSLDENYRVVFPKDYSTMDIIILVDYFGLTGNSVQKDLDFLGHTNVIVDACMSLWTQLKSDVPIFYSLRKFFGVPDGGYLKNPSEITLLKRCKSSLSKARARHLFLRQAGKLEKGRSEFAIAEESFSLDTKPHTISTFTQKLISNINFEKAYKKRRTNFRYLKKCLLDSDIVVESIPKNTAPLCLPIHNKNASDIVTNLAKKGIFCARYWPNLSLPKDDLKGLELLEKTFYLPIDQRYGKHEMNLIASELRRFL